MVPAGQQAAGIVGYTLQPAVRCGGHSGRAANFRNYIGKSPWKSMELGWDRTTTYWESGFKVIFF